MASPPLTLAVEPSASGKAYYLPIAAAAAGEKELCKIVLRLRLKNTGTQDLKLSGVVFSFPGSNHAPKAMKGVKIAVSTNASEDKNDGTIEAGTTVTWSNGVVDLDTSKEGKNEIRNEVYAPVPAPPKVCVSVGCDGYSDTVSTTLDLVPYVNPTGEGALILPFAPKDLAPGEFIVTTSKHWANGGPNGTQIFAHDIGIEAKVGGQWSALLGNTSDENSDHRIWGKPIRAVADGIVDSFENNAPNNPAPGKEAPNASGGGNFVTLIHGGIKVSYAHMQKGSLKPAVLVKGAKVKAGQELGLAGNSGNSSGPHLHLEGVDTTTGALRGLPFKNGWVLAKDQVKDDSSGPWVRLTADGISAEPVAIWPCSTYPRTLFSMAGISRSGDWSNSYFHGDSLESFSAKAQALFDTEKRRLISCTTYLENGKRRWLGVSRGGDWANRFWVSDGLESFQKTAQELFDQKGLRLVHVSTYPEGKGRKFVGIARSGDWASSFWISNDRSSFEKRAQQLFDQNGQRLIWATTWREGVLRRWAGIARSGDWGSSFWISNDQQSFTQKVQQLFDEKQQRLIHVHTYVEGSDRRWLGIARTGDWGHRFFVHSDIDTFGRKAQDLFDEQGLRLEHVEILDNEA